MALLAYCQDCGAGKQSLSLNGPTRRVDRIRSSSLTLLYVSPHASTNTHNTLIHNAARSNTACENLTNHKGGQICLRIREKSVIPQPCTAQRPPLVPALPSQNTDHGIQGGKNRRRGKNENDNEKRELTFKEEGQEYAQVVKMLGNGRLEATCFDGAKRLAHIRGKLRKKVWINQGDIILLSLRDYQDDKGDVILKYSADEARSLKAYGELPESAKINETDTYGHEGVDDNVEFDEDRDSDSDKEVDIDDI